MPHEPKVIDPPETIYLQTGGLDDALKDVAFSELDEVTWCWHSIDDDDIKYVRADLVAAEREARKDEARDAARLLRLGADHILDCAVGDDGVQLADAMRDVATKLWSAAALQAEQPESR